MGHARCWVEEAWQLRVLSIAQAWHMLHAQQDPCTHCPVGLAAPPLTWLVVEVLVVGDKQGMSGDKVTQDMVSVGTSQATAEQLRLATQCLLGQPAHVGHREHLPLGCVASLHGHLHESLQGDAAGGHQKSACHPQGHQSALRAFLDEGGQVGTEEDPPQVTSETVLVQLQEPLDVLSAPGDWAGLLQGLLQEPALLQAVDVRGSNPWGGGWRWQWGWRRNGGLKTRGRGWKS